jgi:peptidyl-prolyl cis-trans isomerase D
MSLKKRSTTGLPGSTKRDAALRKQFKPRAHRENEVNRLVLILSGVIALVIIVILGGAFLIDGVVRPNQAVATVGGTSIGLRDYQQRVIFERWQRGIQIQQVYQNQYLSQQLADSTTAYGAMYNQLNDPPTFGKTVLDEMVNGLAVEQYAAKNNLAISDSELQQDVNRGFGYDPNAATATPTGTPSITPSPIVSPTPTSSPTPTIAPTMSPTPFPTDLPTGIPTGTPGPTQQLQQLTQNQSDFFTSAAKGTNLSVDTVKKLYNDMIRETETAKKVQTSLFGQPKPLQDEVKARHILVATQAQAQSIVAALKGGASFAALAAADSTDTGSGAQGGELGWAPHSGKYVAEFEAYLWDPKTQVGAISDPPIQSQYGYHVIQVEARQQRTLTDQEQQDVLTYQYTQWITTTKTSLNVQTFDSVWTNNTPTTPDLNTDFGVPANLSQGANSSGLPAGLGQ